MRKRVAFVIAFGLLIGLALPSGKLALAATHVDHVDRSGDTLSLRDGS